MLRVHDVHPMDDAVADLVKAQRLREAAELASAHGDHGRASEIYEQACAWSEAADEALKNGDAARSLRMAALGNDASRGDAALDRLTRALPEAARIAAELEARGAWAWAARTHERVGNAPAAARSWERAGEAERAARLLEAQGDLHGAARALEGALRRDPHRPSALLALGALLLRLGRVEAATRVLQRLPSPEDEAGQTPESTEGQHLLARAMELLGMAEAPAPRGSRDLSAPQSEDPPRPAEAPVLYGRYQVIASRASSATARVYEAVDRLDGQRVAVKVFAGHDHLSTRGAGRDALARFEREVQILRALAHPNVVPLRDYVQEGPALVTIWMSGGTLEERLASCSLTPRRGVEIACALLSALGEAHRASILHRDVKPSNVLFDDAGVTYLADFGVAHLGDASATATAAVIGTQAYMSPEQRRGEPATPRSDLYAVGVLLREMAGLHPDLGHAHRVLLAQLAAPDAEARVESAFEARRRLLALTWPDTAAPRHPPSVPTLAEQGTAPALPMPNVGRLTEGPRGPHDRWVRRDVTLWPLSADALTRAGAFARADDDALQTVLRVDHGGGHLWLEVPPGGPVPHDGGPLSEAQRAVVARATAALRRQGLEPSVGEGAEHLCVDEDGRVTVLFAAVAGDLPQLRGA